MKATRTVTASAAIAAMALAWWRQHCHNARANDARLEERCMREALDIFEGEGGMVVP